MSQFFSQTHPCRWKWCNVVFSTNDRLLDHVAQHVEETKPCELQDLALLLRAEEGIGEGLSGSSYNGYSQPEKQQEATQSSASNDSCLPSPPATSPSHSSDISPFISRMETPLQTPTDYNRPSKRRKIAEDSSLSSYDSFLLHHHGNTPKISDIGLEGEHDEEIDNPAIPDLNTLLANHMRANGNPNAFSPLASDDSVERHLTQDIGDTSSSLSPGNIPKSLNLYSGELRWVDSSEEDAQSPKSQGYTPTSSQSANSFAPSQAQRGPNALSVDKGLPISVALPSPITFSKSYVSRSTKIVAPTSPETINPRLLMQGSPERTFVPQSQAPYYSQPLSP
ncbi:unnamed protein product [Mycena citricolor]|uniref:C2H2-type domain-containing protein n=1 Tax=Mycena citricolor TaxID=2018698 RepID=A0AAD2K2I2_9AGAR|nr:unnamed protein product [Mycena citricolor]